MKTRGGLHPGQRSQSQLQCLHLHREIQSASLPTDKACGKRVCRGCELVTQGQFTCLCVTFSRSLTHEIFPPRQLWKLASRGKNEIWRAKKEEEHESRHTTCVKTSLLIRLILRGTKSFFFSFGRSMLPCSVRDEQINHTPASRSAALPSFFTCCDGERKCTRRTRSRAGNMQLLWPLIEGWKKSKEVHLQPRGRKMNFRLTGSFGPVHRSRFRVSFCNICVALLSSTEHFFLHLKVPH